MYNGIVNEINVASDKHFPQTKFKPFLKPYWNNDLKHLHKCMRHKRQEWILEGKPRSNNYMSYTEYKSAKRQFRKLHRQCASNYLKKMDEDIDNAAGVDCDYFWKLITTSNDSHH